MGRPLLVEGEKRITDLPVGQEAVMVEQVLLGRRFLSVEKYGIEVSRVLLTDYTSWDSAFDAVMDKAGL